MAQQPKQTILILAANPRGTVPLRLDEEVREIREGLQRSQQRDSFEVVYRSAARPRDVQRAMLECRPQIVHFCGHGEGADGLALEDEAGKTKLVSTAALADLFKLFADRLECVLLNACYSDVQAAVIAQHINYVIGMNQAISDRAAIEFAVSFYDALGARESVEFAFRLGVNAMQLAGITEENTPVLVPKTVSQAQLASPLASDTSLSQLQQSPEPMSSGTRARLFISYKRGVKPDQPLAEALFRELSQDHDVFIDQTMAVGTRWAERIEAEIRQADFLISLLSAHAVQSEMVVGEIETAHRLSKLQGKPQLLPVRAAFQVPFAYPLSAYLNGINWAVWDSPADIDRLLQELRQAIAGGNLAIHTEASKPDQAQAVAPSASALPFPFPAAQIPTLEPPEGTMAAESQFYVERADDYKALSAIQRPGVTITIKAPRQMGKSSLLIRIVDAAMQAEKRVVFLDFQLLDHMALTDADRFLRQFCQEITHQVELDSRVEEFWRKDVSSIQRCTDYLQMYVLKALKSPLLLAMDEVDRMFDTDFGSDFFSMLRSWHNKRALPTTRVWRQLDLALVTATEPYHLIANLNQSPFNVGEVITLTDFTLEQVAALNQKHGEPLNASQERQLMDWLAGHPYLVRKALYLVASGQLTVEHLFARASDDRGPFGDHLRYHLFRINDRPDLIQGLRQVLQTQTCPDQRVMRLLSAAGLVYRDDKQAVVPRCRLYAEYFREQLHG
jgi:hypothetical protein